MREKCFKSLSAAFQMEVNVRKHHSQSYHLYAWKRFHNIHSEYFKHSKTPKNQTKAVQNKHRDPLKRIKKFLKKAEKRANCRTGESSAQASKLLGKSHALKCDFITIYLMVWWPLLRFECAFCWFWNYLIS